MLPSVRKNSSYLHVYAYRNSEQKRNQNDKRKGQGVPQLKAAVNPWLQEEEKKDRQ